MTQFSFGNIDEATTDGYKLADYLEQFEAAVNSGHSGPSAPAYAVQGMVWRNTSANPHLICVYDNTTWVVQGQLNPTTHVYRPWVNGAPVQDIASLLIGNGLQSSGGNLLVKADAGIAVGSGGVKLNMGLTPGAYSNVNITIDANGNLSAVATGGTQLPVGFNYWAPSTVIPSGFLHVNGQTVSRAGTYAPLWAYANASSNVAADATDFANNPGKFGIGDGVSTFQIPDTRGLFMRSWDAGAGRDVNSPGRGIGTYQADDNKSHSHTLKWVNSPQGGGTRIPQTHVSTLFSGDIGTAAQGSSEATPRNIAWTHILKY